MQIETLFFYNYWSGGECVAGKPSSLQNAEIYSSLKKWDRILEDRYKKFNILWKFSVDGLKKPTDRYPCVVPIKYNKLLIEYIKNDFSSGTRMMEKIDDDESREIIKIVPIPIHQDIDLQWIKKIEFFLNKQQ